MPMFRRPGTCDGNVSGGRPLRIDFTTRIVSTLDTVWVSHDCERKKRIERKIDKILATIGLFIFEVERSYLKVCLL